MEFAHPLVLLLLSPLFLAGWYAIRKGLPKPLIISRMIILGLLIAALASPFVLEMSTVRDDAPRITVISDQTMSMDLFDRESGEKVFESIASKTPTTFRQFAGIRSPIGDEVIASAEGDNNIVLVSDGNNNLGKDLFDAISFVSITGTKVFAVRQDNIRNDASIEIAGPKNLIIGNENVFDIVVRQAGNEISYRLDVEIDGVPVMSEEFTQYERIKTYPVSHTFDTLGTHTLTAKITPSTEDRFNLNNMFYKSVFVVPKPRVLFLASDTGSPLYEIASDMYDVTGSTSMPDDMDVYKAVIADNRAVGQLSADILREYVGNGGGFVAIGGDLSYDMGNYNNSPVEALLPIISRAAEYKGGRNVVIVIDASGSTMATDPTTGESVIGLIDANAMSVVQYIDPGSSVGVVAFGGITAEKEIIPMSSQGIRNDYIQWISEIGPQSGVVPTDIDKGFAAALDMLKTVSGTNMIIVISDGRMPEDFEEVKTKAQELKDENVDALFVLISLTPFTEEEKQRTIDREYSRYQELADIFGTSVNVLDPDQRICTSDKPCLEGEEIPDAVPTPSPTPEFTFEFPLIALDTEHFITQFVNITASVTGYNDVTPKLGSDRLVATTGGKPILTTWGFGLGRVASFTTDSGAGETRWASEVYSGENSRLISSMINWAIGDPQPDDGVVIQAEDIWAGTSGKVVIKSDDLPRVVLDGTGQLDLSRTGPDTYETTLSLEIEGFHNLSGYGIAVNYPLEYREIGFNERLKTVIAANGGRVYDMNEVESLLLLDIKEKAVRTVQQPVSRKEPFLLAALLLFLGEVIIRRLKDRGRERPVIGENP